MTQSTPVVAARPQAMERRTRSAGKLWTSRILTVLTVAFLLFDAAMKIALPPSVLKASAPLGFGASTLPGIGISLVACTVLFVIPRTAVLGAALLTAYLGGAVACQVRIGAPAFNFVFPVLFSVLLWASLWLRLPQLRTVFPIISSESR